MWQLEQRPMTINQTISKSYELWKAAFKTEIVLLAVFCLISLVITLVLDGYLVDFSSIETYSFNEPYHLGLIIAMGTIYLLTSFVVFGAVLARLEYFNNNQKLTIAGSLQFAFKKLPIFILALIIVLATNLFSYANILYQNHYYILAIIFGILGVYLFPVFNLYYTLIVIENLGPFAAYKRALYLIWNNWWRTALVLISPFFFALLILLAAYTALPVLLIYFKLKGMFSEIFLLVMHTLCTLLFISGAIVVSFVQIYNLRARKGEQLSMQNTMKLNIVNG